MAPTSEKKQVVASHLTGQSSNHNQVRSESIVRFARKETIWSQQQFWGANQMSCWLQELGVDSSVLLPAGWGSSGGGILKSMPDSMLSKSVRDSCGKYRQAAGSSSEMLSIRALSLAPDLCVNTFIGSRWSRTYARKTRWHLHSAAIAPTTGAAVPSVCTPRYNPLWRTVTFSSVRRRPAAT